MHYFLLSRSIRSPFKVLNDFKPQTYSPFRVYSLFPLLPLRLYTTALPLEATDQFDLTCLIATHPYLRLIKNCFC